ncbi:MAG: isoaspartyl peptidase [Faecousia sp.]
MEQHKRYITRKRARFISGGKQVNIPYGTPLEVRDGFLFWEGRPLCTVTSQNAYDYFSQDDDGRGLERGGLVDAIKSRLEKRDAGYQARWDKVWESPLCLKYKRPEHEDYFLWNHDFYNAPIGDLQSIAALVGARPAGRRK